MKKNHVRKMVRDIFIELLPESRKGFNFNKKQDAYRDWDSFVHMQLVSKIEQAFHLTLGTKEAIEADSPSAFIKIISKEI